MINESLRESLLKESLVLQQRNNNLTNSMADEVEKRKKTLQAFTGLSDDA